jgi:hypothetical protein
VVELMIAATLAFVALVVVGVFLSVFSAVGWFLWLPFKVIGWMFRLVGLVIAAPFILLAVLLGGVGMLLSVGVLFLPLFPLLLIGGLAWWFFRRKPAAPSHASVVS